MDQVKNLFPEGKAETKVEEETPRNYQTEYACTVVNLLPFPLYESKPMMIPSAYYIPAAKGEVPGLGYVKEGLHFIPNPMIEEGKPGANIRQITPPAEMARSICDDFNVAHIALEEDAKPGVFWVEGKLVYSDVVKFHSKELKTARRQQTNWFRNLINMADADWQKHKNMMSVSDLQRLAAKSIGIERDWVNWIEPDKVMACKFCQSTINSASVICAICRQVVNPERFKELQGVEIHG